MSYPKTSHLLDWPVSAVFLKTKAVEEKVYKKEKVTNYFTLLNSQEILFEFISRATYILKTQLFYQI